MIRSLYSGTSGLKNHQTRMDVIANNIANVNTTGFKSGRVNFAEIISQDYRGNSISQVGVNTNNPAQIGLGISISSIDNIFTPGGLQTTGRTLDLALTGDGFFMIAGSDYEDTEQVYYTRDGAFYVDNEGYLVNSAGLYVLNTDGEKIQLVSDPSTDNIQSIKVNTDGSIYVNAEPIEQQIGVAIFNNPEALAKAGGNLYKSPDVENVIPVENPTGFVIQSGVLEMSNVDLANDFSNLIITQRGYQANAKIVTTSDQMLGELIDMKR